MHFSPIVFPNLRWAALAFYIGASVSCSSGGERVEKSTIPSETTTTIASVPVLNLDQNLPLPQARLDELIQIALRLPPAANAGRKVWFVAAFSNKPDYFHQIVYYVPDSTSARVRRGRCALFWWWTMGTMNQSGFVQEYVQVSRPDAPFDGALSVPPAVDLPFTPPEGRDMKRLDLSDDDLVALIDAARPAIDPEVDFASYPCIFLIGQRGENEFHLATGNTNGGLLFVLKRKADGGFLVADRAIPWSGSPF